MFGSNILDVAIGIVFVFILISTICSAIREFIEAKLKTRAAYLEQGIRQLLNDKTGTGLAKALFEHPLIDGLFNGTYTPGIQNDSPDLLATGKNLPSYIPSKNFAAALMDIAATGKNTDQTNDTRGATVIDLVSMRKNVADIGNTQIQRVLLNAIDTAQGDLNKAQSNIEDWYNSCMDRVSGWYKRSTQWVIFWIAFAVTILLNVNTITIVQYLSQNDTQRKVVVEKAAGYAKNDKPLNQGKELNELKLPIGWDQSSATAFLSFEPAFSFSKNILSPLLGWLITIFAATLGAPFWFDILNRIMVIRSTVKPHEKSGEEDSQDNATKAPQVAVAEQAKPIKQAVDVPPGQDQLIANAEPDGCDVVATALTADELLPASKGGTVI